MRSGVAPACSGWVTWVGAVGTVLVLVGTHDVKAHRTQECRGQVGLVVVVSMGARGLKVHCAQECEGQVGWLWFVGVGSRGGVDGLCDVCPATETRGEPRRTQKRADRVHLRARLLLGSECGLDE